MKNCVVFYFLGQIETLNSHREMWRKIEVVSCPWISFAFDTENGEYERVILVVERECEHTICRWDDGNEEKPEFSHHNMLHCCNKPLVAPKKKSSLRFSNKLIFFSLFLLHIWHTLMDTFFCFMSSRETHFVIIWTVRTRVTQIHWGCWGK